MTQVGRRLGDEQLSDTRKNYADLPERISVHPGTRPKAHIRVSPTGRWRSVRGAVRLKSGARRAPSQANHAQDWAEESHDAQAATSTSLVRIAWQASTHPSATSV